MRGCIKKVVAVWIIEDYNKINNPVGTAPTGGAKQALPCPLIKI